MLKIMHILTLANKLMIKILNFKLVIVEEYQNTKNSFAKGYTPNWSEGKFVTKKVKNIVSWTYVNNDLNGEVVCQMERL